MNIRRMLGTLAFSLMLYPATAWPSDPAVCREHCDEQAGRAFATCRKQGQDAESCEVGAHQAFASCVTSQCEMGTAESCAARCDTVGAEVRAHCLEDESGRLVQCEERGEEARGRCAQEQC